MNVIKVQEGGEAEKKKKWRNEGQISLKLGLPGGSEGEESASNAGDPGSIPGSGRSLGEGMTTHSSIRAWRIPCTEGL